MKATVKCAQRNPWKRVDMMAGAVLTVLVILTLIVDFYYVLAQHAGRGI